MNTVIIAEKFVNRVTQFGRYRIGDLGTVEVVNGIGFGQPYFSKVEPDFIPGWTVVHVWFGATEEQIRCPDLIARI